MPELHYCYKCTGNDGALSTPDGGRIYYHQTLEGCVVSLGKRLVGLTSYVEQIREANGLHDGS